MNHWIRKIISRLVPSYSERANQSKLRTKYMPYKGAYFFTHVPKTGGTSFIVFLDRFFPAKVIFPHQLWVEIDRFSEISKQQYNLIRGHFGGCTANLFTDKEIKNLTILRDPVKLAYSTYEYVKREKNTALNAFVLSEKMNFLDFLKHPKTKHLVTNRMVHNLVFGHGYDTSVENMSISDKTFPEFRKKINQGQVKLNDKNRLQLAESFLEHCLWFGILERYDDSLRLLCFTMAWPPQGQSQKLNVNKIKPVITDEAISLAKSLNVLDSALYEQAVEKFDKKYNEMLASLGADPEISDKELDDLLDKSYQDSYVSKYGYELAESIEYDCSEILLGGQWHRREWNSLGKSYFRWSGPGETSFIDFWVKQNNYDIEITVVDAIDTTLLDELKIDINGHAKKISHTGDGKSRTLQFKCNSSDITDAGLLRINLHSKNLQSHKRFFSSGDGRVVGFAMSAIKIEKNH